MSEYTENVKQKTSERKEYQRKVANAFAFWKAENLLIKPVDKDRIIRIADQYMSMDNKSHSDQDTTEILL